MLITVTRINTKRYATIVERDDGVRLSVPGYGFMRALPHDLAHYVVETALGLQPGFWGSVADGARFSGMNLIDGRQKPHADERAKAVGKANAAYLGEAEKLVAGFEAIVGGSLDRNQQRAEARLKEASASVRHPARRIGRADIVALCAAWRAMQSRWDDLPIHDFIGVEWRHAIRRAGRHHRR